MEPLLLALIVVLAALPLLAGAAIVWRRTLLLALPWLATLNGLPIRLGQNSVRLDQLAAAALLVGLLLAVVAGRRKLYVDGTLRWLAVFFAIGIAASVANSPVPGYSLAQSLNVASVWGVYLLLVNHLETDADRTRFFGSYVASAIVACAVGIAAFALNAVGVPVGGAQTDSSTTETLAMAYGAYGTMFEPNIFGSYSQSAFLIGIGLLALGAATPASGVSARRVRLLIATAAMALVLSFTRAAWVGTIAGLGILLTLAARHFGVRVRWSRILGPAAAVAVASAVMYVVPGPAGDFFRYKADNLLNVFSSTALVRLMSYSLILTNVAEHPILGSGTYSFGPIVAGGADFRSFEGYQKLWIGNWVLAPLHDAGVLGLIAFLGAMIWLIRRGLRSVRTLRAAHPIAASRALALTVAVIAVLIPFLTATGFPMGWSWMLLGMLGAEVRGAAASTPAPVPSGRGATGDRSLDDVQ
ncbi:MAG TPA: O-antigen ligase family protein [Gemmatimonadaceae bacterium]|nr:O-antigen ligase family protein [Gemmatimonadaceae bacterium]